MSSIWTASAAEVAAVTPLEGEYIAIVQFTRNKAEDAEYAATPDGLAIQLAKELQEGFDLAAIAGRFQVIRVEA